MISNEILHELAKSKFGLEESSISNNGTEFIILGNNGEVYTDKDFTDLELNEAINTYNSNLTEFLNSKAAAKAALLEKLGLTEDEAKLLLS